MTHVNAAVMPLLFVALLVSGLGASAADGANLMRNGDFAQVEPDGRLLHWQIAFSGKGLEGSYSVVPGPEQSKAVRIECTAFPETLQQGWVILKQDGSINTRQGQRLHLSFWVKREGLKATALEVWIMRLKPWGSIAQTSVPVTADWQKVEAIVTPGEDCDNTRFETFFTEKGVLYLSDIRVEETALSAVEVNPVRRRMIEETPLPTEKNVVANSSFEVGTQDWGTEDFDHNVLKIDGSQAFHGQQSARIDFDESSLPTGYSDYPRARKIVQKQVRCVSRGWLKFEKGKTYVLSAHLKSTRAGHGAEIGVWFMTQQKAVKSVVLGTAWQRYAVEFDAADSLGFIGIQAGTEDNSEKVWIDAVQLERGSTPSDYVPRHPVEIGFSTARPGGLHYTGEPPVFRALAWRGAATADADVAFHVTDYRERVVHEGVIRASELAAAGELRIPAQPNGYYRFAAELRGDGSSSQLTLPFIVVFRYAETYGSGGARFGTNHPYYSDLLQGLARDAGVYWVRDWTLKWDNVEPAKGEFDFSVAEEFYGRAARFGLRVLAILPDPSSGWASSGPPELRGKRLGDAYAGLWYLPKDMADFETYARACMTKFHAQTQVWEVLNEPFKTQGWSLDERYHEFLSAAKRAGETVGNDPRIMRCGLVYFKTDRQANAAAVRMADVLSEHTYPTYNSTSRFLNEVAGVDGFLRENQLTTDIWVTEYGKYADDKPHYNQALSKHIMENGSERLATAYSVKYLTVLFSHGASKVFFHLRTWPLGLNVKSHGVHFDMLFKYDAEPHKFFVAANAMSWFLAAASGPGRPVCEKGPVFAYRFGGPKNEVLVVWADEHDREPRLLPGADGLADLQVYDMMGGRLQELSIGEEPVYVVAPPEQIDRLAALLAPER